MKERLIRTDRLLPAHHDTDLLLARHDEANVLSIFVDAEAQL
jgi:hypothetical protein